MLRRILTILLPMLLFICISTSSSHPAFAFTHARPKPLLALNRQQGPLGITLTLRGQNFTPGQAQLSYVDAHGMPGAFVAPSDSSVQVQANGSFMTTDLILPASGPVGTWKIVVTESTGRLLSTTYLVLAAPGQQVAGAPTLTLNPANETGTGRSVIAFVGSNWLPAGTAVKFDVLMGTTTIPILQTPPLSDQNGMITGTFSLPANLNQPQVTVVASDVSTGALRVQVPLLATSLSPTASASPTVSPTVASSANPTAVPTNTPQAAVTPVPAGTTNGGDVLSGLNAAIWGPALLVVGGALAVAALVLLLFLIPWGEQRRMQPRRRQY